MSQLTRLIRNMSAKMVKLCEKFPLVSTIVSAIPKDNEKRIICTHDGRFHCDDVTACVLLSLLPDYKDAIIIRTRDSEIHAKSDIVVDVGGIYDPEKRRFDHHQRGCEVYFDEVNRRNVRLSSAGMIWKHFGVEICSLLLKQTDAVATDDNTASRMQSALYETLFESIDGLDNGVDCCPAGVAPMYMVRSDLTTRVSRLNLDWTDERWDDLAAEEFKEAMKIAAEEFFWHVFAFAHLQLPARCIVEEAFNKRREEHHTGRVLVLEKGCPWEKHLFDLEKEHSLDSSEQILFIVHPNLKDWRVRAVRESMDTFNNRLGLMSAYRGLRDSELKTRSSIEGINFVHIAGFLAGTKDKKAALALVDETFKEAGIIVETTADATAEANVLDHGFRKNQD